MTWVESARSRTLRLVRDLGLLVLALASMSVAPTAGAMQAVEGLTPGIALERPAVADQVAAYRLRVGVGERAVLTVEQLGADVTITARWGSEEPWRVDAPLDRDGTEVFLLPPPARGEIVVELEVTSAVGPAPRYRIRLDLLPEVTAEGPRLEGLGALTAAGRGWAEGTGEGRRRALDFYRRGAELWRDLGDEHLTAQSLFAVCVLHRILGEYARGLEVAKEVLPAWQALGDRTFEAATWVGIGLMESSAGRTDAAREAFGNAREVQAGIDDTYRMAAIANNFCLTHLIDGELRRGVECYGPALDTIRAAGDRETESVALTNLGRAHRKLGEPVEALDAFERALEILRGGEWPKREAQTLTRLGMLRRTFGELEDAARLYLQALEIFRRLGDWRWQAWTLHNLGATYAFLGDRPRAEALLLEGLAMHRELENQSGEATSWRYLGHLLLKDRRPIEARDAYRQARDLARAMEDSHGEALAAHSLARAELDLDDPEGALITMDTALVPLRGGEAPGSLAYGLVDRGRILTELGRPEAVEDLHEALGLFRRLGDPHGESWTLYHLADAYRAKGQSEEALAQLDQALELFEALRVEIGNPDLQATFAGARRGAYELQTELLAADRSDDSLARAFAASERARAWGVTELLRQSSAGWAAGLERRDPELAEHLRSARRNLYAAASRRDELGTGATAIDRRRAETTISHALAELERTEAEARKRFPALGTLALQATPAVTDVQESLGPGTALLEYLVGEDRSFLFVVTAEDLASFELPGREVVETVVRRARQELVDSASEPDAWLRGSAANLSRQILHPALPMLETAGIERVVIVADGALHYLPFSVLPLPAVTDAERKKAMSQPLLERFESTYLPSAGVLALERQRRAGRPPAPYSVAVLADPVFDSRDLRLPPGLATELESAEPKGGFEMLAGLDLPRLRASRSEAEAIAALAGSGGTFVALGFDAHRDQLLDGRLDRYRILHLATHGIVDDRHAVLSGLVFSRFDAAGRPRNGHLRLTDIYHLSLRADLVVLSACRTALGREVRGEGLLGLTRAFLHAGASRVMASLWSVPDRATAELMQRFYRALWQDRLSPPAALRRAQQSMLAEPRWSAPRQWAGFVLVGDWRSPVFASANGNVVR